MNTRKRAEEIKIKNTGTKKYPYYVIYEGRIELCHTIDIDNARKIVKCLTSLSVVTDEEISALKNISDYSRSIYKEDSLPDLRWYKDMEIVNNLLSRLQPSGKTEQLKESSDEEKTKGE